MVSRTDIGTRTYILSDLWMNYRNDSEFVEFIKYNDLGLPLAYAITAGLVETTPAADTLINETFDLLLELRDLDVSTIYDSLEDLLELVDNYDIPVLSTLKRVKFGHGPKND
jgi:hypothetical protein